jgi:uncharacterized membrane protein
MSSMNERSESAGAALPERRARRAKATGPDQQARGGDRMRHLPARAWKLPQHEDDEATEQGIGRILALSDGVFAIAATLLIIEIAVPAVAGDDRLSRALLGLWPRYLAYLLSFLVIARFWVIHHQAFRLIARFDTALVWLNLLLLMFVAFLPFPTAVLGRHVGSPVAAALYAISVALVASASAACWWYASGPARLLRPHVRDMHIRAMRARGLFAVVFFALTFPVAMVAPYAAEILWVLAFPLSRITFAWFSVEKDQQPKYHECQEMSDM